MITKTTQLVCFSSATTINIALVAYHGDLFSWICLGLIGAESIRLWKVVKELEEIGNRTRMGRLDA